MKNKTKLIISTIATIIWTIISMVLAVRYPDWSPLCTILSILCAVVSGVNTGMYTVFYDEDCDKKK